MRDDSTAPARRHRPPQEARSGGLEGGRYPSYSQGTPRGQTVSLHRPRPLARSPAHAPGRAPDAGDSKGLEVGGVAQRHSGRARGPLNQVWSLRTEEEGRPAPQRRLLQPAEQRGRGGAWAGTGAWSGWAGPWEALACERVGCSHSVVPEHLRKAVAEASRLESRHLPEGRPQVTASRDRVEK